MLHGKKIIVVMRAYNASKTLEVTYKEIPFDIVDEIIVVDDASGDETSKRIEELGIHAIIHPQNVGYGGNQKTCYREALSKGADIIVMVHPDYQYSPRLITAMASMITSGHYDIALGSRILGGDALKGGMPFYKYIANRFLTLFQNLILGIKLSEYHTGYRAFSRKILETLPLEENSNDFVFDNEILVQAVYYGFKIGEISCPTRYFANASSINFKRGLIYGFGVLGTTLKYILQKLRIKSSPIFSKNGRTLIYENY